MDGIKTHFLDVKDIPIKNWTSLKCTMVANAMEKGWAVHLIPLYITPINEFRKMISEYTSAFLLVNEHVNAGANDILESWFKF